MKCSATLAVGALTGLASVGCLDVNASQPPEASETFGHAQAETSIALIDDSSTPSGTRVLLAFNDTTQYFCSAPDHLVKNHIGLSESRDLGLSWTRTAIPLPDDTCLHSLPSTSPCLNELFSDPWLASEGDAATIVAMGATLPAGATNACDGGDPNVIMYSDRAAGEGFGQWQVLKAYGSTVVVDKPSVDRRNGFTAAAFRVGASIIETTQVFYRVGGGAWSATPIIVDHNGKFFAFNPIIKVVSDELMYVAALPANTVEPNEVRMTRLSRTTLGDWGQHPIFKGEPINVRTTWPAAAGGASPTFRDFVPSGFDVSVHNDEPHLWLAFAYRPDSSGDQSIVLEDCVDVGHATCTEESGWRVRVFTPSPGTSFLQPNVIAADDDLNVRVTWYHMLATGELQPEGRSSINGGATWAPAVPLTADVAQMSDGGISYEACVHPKAPNFFGDYFDSEFLPVQTFSLRNAITAFSDSRGGCGPGESDVHDLHVQAARW